MFISTSENLVFIHVPKTGGTSINDVLIATFGQPDRRCARPEPNPAIRLLRRLRIRRDFGKHEFALDVRAEMGAEFDNSFSFAFIRNPWDWLVSMYTFIRQKGVSPDTGRPWRHALFPIVRDMSFEEFVEWVTEHDGLALLPGRLRSSFAKSTPVRQKDWIVDLQDEIIIDYVGRFERLEEDVAVVWETMGRPVITLPRVNQSSRLNYRTYYSQQMRDAVFRYFKSDIETFGYEF